MYRTIFKFESKKDLNQLLAEIDLDDNYVVEGLDVIFEIRDRFMAEGILGYYSDILDFKGVDFDYSFEGQEEDLEPINYWREYGLTDRDFL